MYQDRLYYVKKGGYLTAINPISGEPFFESKKIGVSGEYYASPIGVDGQILVASKEGIITLFKASDEFEIIKKIDMEESILSSPAIVDETHTLDRQPPFGFRVEPYYLSEFGPGKP